MNYKKFRRCMACICMSGVLLGTSAMPALADESEIQVIAADDETATSSEQDATDSSSGSEAAAETPAPTPEVTPTPTQQDTSSTSSDQNTQAQQTQAALPISATLSGPSGSAGSIDITVSLTNGTFIYSGQDMNAIFGQIPSGVSVSVAGTTDNSITYHISGTAAEYTKTDLTMTIPAGWIKNTAGETVMSATAVTGHDLYWRAHKDDAIELRSHGSTMTNEQLIASQSLDSTTLQYDKLRFVHEDIQAQCFNTSTYIQEYPADDARAVGTAKENTVVYVIANYSDDWVYCESGNVRGFVKASAIKNIESGKDASKLAKAHAIVDKTENKAYTYLKVTASSTEAETRYVVAKQDTTIYTEKDEDSQAVATLANDGLVNVILKEGNWYYIESDDVRGFVKVDSFYTEDESAKKITEAANGAASFAGATAVIDAANNKAFYYSLKSSKQGSIEEIVRDSIVEYTKSFIGNPYVWGGTDPVNGADCSGLVQTVYSRYGISLPRTSKEQAYSGHLISLSALEKGDLIFYADDAEIYHVVMYAGDGKTVEAADESVGIVSRDVNQTNAVWGVRFDASACSYDVIKSMTLSAPSYEYGKKTLVDDKNVKVKKSGKNKYAVICKAEKSDDKTYIYDGQEMTWSSKYKGYVCFVNAENKKEVKSACKGNVYEQSTPDENTTDAIVANTTAAQ